MKKPLLHIQNIFDILNPSGDGVRDTFKEKCLQVQNRVLGMVRSGDFVAVDSYCPAEFIDYILTLKDVNDVTVLRFDVGAGPNDTLSAETLFASLLKDLHWDAVLRQRPLLNPYMQSVAIYTAARKYGIDIDEAVWQNAVTERVPELMNDKALLYQTCCDIDVPVPEHWLSYKNDLIDTIIELLSAGQNRLFIRQTLSGGGFGSIAVERHGGMYYIHELGLDSIDEERFVFHLKDFAERSLGEEFIISRLLDLYASPGTLYYVDDDGVSILCHTYQMLNSLRGFIGMMYPIEDRFITRHYPAMERALLKLVEPWRLRGYRGYGNIDWMVTPDGEMYIAEINARETAVIPPIRIANELAMSHSASDSIEGGALPPMVGTAGLAEAQSNTHLVSPPAQAMFSRNVVPLSDNIDFNAGIDILIRNGLLYTHDNGTGTLITIPPEPALGIHSLGILSIAQTPGLAYDIYIRTLAAFGKSEGEMLFKPAI